MEVYISMVSGYEETRALGVYDTFDKALEVAENFIKNGDYEYSAFYNNAYVIKAKMNGNIISYMGRGKKGVYEIYE